MSQTYVELYQNKIKYQNTILSDNKENISRNQKIISLIKKFPVKQRKTFKIDKSFKPRRIQSKSVEMIQKYRKTSNKKKTNSKQKLENNKNKDDKGDNEIKSNKKNDIQENNNNNQFFEINNFHKTEVNKNNFPKFFTDLIQTCDTNNEKDIKKNNEEENHQKNINEEEEKEFIFNKVNKFDNINKSKINNSIETYFDIFRMRKHAASFKDKINNINMNKYNSNNNLYKNYISNENSKYNSKHQKAKSYSDFSKKKSKTYYKAIKLKEKIENNLLNKNKSSNMYSSSNNFYSKSKLNINNDKNEKNKNIVIEMNQHFFDGNEKKPKLMKKYMTFNGTLNTVDVNKGLKNNNISDNLRARTFRLFSNNNENSKENGNFKNNLFNQFSSEIYQVKFKRKVNFSDRSLNLIVESNPKLNNLLKKIPSNRGNKDKSFELINYITQIRNKSVNPKYISNIKYNSDIKIGICPANDWEPISKLKRKNLE